MQTIPLDPNLLQDVMKLRMVIELQMVDSELDIESANKVAK